MTSIFKFTPATEVNVTKKKDLLNSTAEVELFHSRDFWNQEDNIIESVTLALSPHSEIYYSSLCPIFSFELQKIDSLNLFSHVQLRDGLIFLLDFFLRNPEPKNLRTQISVESSMAAIVPESWRNQVSYYSYKSNVDVKSTQGFYIVGLEKLTDQKFSEIISDINEMKDKGIKDITIIPTIISSFNKKDRGAHPATLANFSLKLSKEINGVEINFQSMENLKVSKLKGSLARFNKDLLLWCGDSYLKQYLLSNGAICWSENEELGETEVELSLYHKAIISKKVKSEDIEISNQLWAFINKMNLQLVGLGDMNRIDGELDEYVSAEVIGLADEVLNALKGTKEKNLFKKGS